jgi:hypothetical protein
MPRPFLPRGTERPPGITHERFTLRPITIHDAVKDYDAVMTSAERLRERLPLWGWPPEDLSLEDDILDLAWHQREGDYNSSFNFAVMSPDEARLLGCVYVDPPEKEDEDAVVAFWVRRDEEEGDLEAVLEAAVREWIASDWPFSAVSWPGRDISWEDWDAKPDRA